MIICDYTVGIQLIMLRFQLSTAGLKQNKMIELKMSLAADNGNFFFCFMRNYQKASENYIMISSNLISTPWRKCNKMIIKILPSILLMLFYLLLLFISVC